MSRPPLPPFTRETAAENWLLDAAGLMAQRHAGSNDVPIGEQDRLFRWDRSGPRPPGHSGRTDLGL